MAQTQVHPQQGPNPFQQMPLMGAQAGGQIGLQVGQQVAAQQTIINNFLNLGTALPTQLEAIRTSFQALGPNPTPAQIETALTQLYNVLRVGGTLGLTYLPDTGREPRAPGAVLARRSGDCDELATTFLAAAMRIGIPLTGVRFAGIDFNSSQQGITSVPHAVLFVNSGGRNLLFDLTRAAPTPVRDFTDATIAGEYRGRSISYGAAGVSPPITGIGRMAVFISIVDVVASQLLAQADYFDTRAQATSGTSHITALADAVARLRDVVTLGSTNQFTTTMTGRVALNVFDRLDRLAESEHNGKNYPLAITHYRDALFLLQSIPSLSTARGSREFDLHKSLADAYRQTGRFDDALGEYAAMMRISPGEKNGFVSAYELNIARYKRAQKIAASSSATSAQRSMARREMATHLTRAYIVLRTVIRSTVLDAQTISTFSTQRTRLEGDLRRLNIDPATISFP
jgi:hypothetical protein